MKKLLLFLATMFAIQTAFAQANITTTYPTTYFSHQENYNQFQNNSNTIIRREPKGYYSVITTRTNGDHPRTKFIIRHDESTNNGTTNAPVLSYTFDLVQNTNADDSSRDYIISDMELWENSCYFCGHIMSSPIFRAPDIPSQTNSASTTNNPEVVEYGFIGKFDLTTTSSDMIFKILPMYRTKRINNMACGHSTNGNNNINMMATGITTTDRSCLIEIHEGS